MTNKQLSLNDEQAFFHLAYRGEVIDAVRGGTNVALTPPQAVFVRNAPLTSFGNMVLDDLQADIFLSLILADLRFHSTAPQGREANRMLLEWLMSDPKFQTMRVNLSGLLVSTAGAANEVVRELLQMPDMKDAMQMLAKAGKMQQDAQDKRDRADQQEQEDQGDGNEDSDDDSDGESGGDGDDQQDDYPDDDEDGNGSGDSDSDDGEESDEDGDGQGQGDDGEQDGEGQPDPTTPDEKRADADQLEQQAETLQKNAADKISKDMQSRFASLSRSGALSEGERLAEQIHAFLTSWGMDEGQVSQMSIDTIRHLMELMTQPGLTNLSALMGRVYGTAQKVLSGRAPVRIKVEKYGRTRDLRDVKKTSLAMLSDDAPPALREKAFNDLVARGLPGVKKVMQSQSEGIFICLKDRSGSMNAGVATGDAEIPSATRSEIATALSLGMARAARENGQQFVCAGFGDVVDPEDVIDENSPLEATLNWALRRDNGGTNMDDALQFAIDTLNSFDETDRYLTDFVFVTDAEASLDKNVVYAFEAIREMYNVRLHVLQVGGNDAYTDLPDLADNVLHFDSLDNVAEVLSRAVWEE